MRIGNPVCGRNFRPQTDYLFDTFMKRFRDSI